MQVNIQFQTGNAAFTDEPKAEVARILHKLASRIEQTGMLQDEEIPLMDYNGNRVGECTID